MSHSSPAPSIRVFPGSVPRYGARPHNTNSNHTSVAAHQQTSSSTKPTNPKPMAIPRAREAPPPPLPPPRHIDGLYNGQDPGWKYGNGRQHDLNSNGQYASVKPGSSLLGGVGDQEFGDHYDYRDSRRGSTMSLSIPIDPEMQGADGLEHSDEDRNSLPRPAAMANFRSQSERQLGQKTLHASAQAYDQQLLSKIGGPNAGNRATPYLTTPTSESPNQHSGNKFSGQLKPLSVPNHPYPSLESPLTRWHSAQSAASSGISPSAGFRSPLFEHNSIDSAFPPRFHAASTPDVFDEPSAGYRSHRNSDDQGVFLDPEFAHMEENGLKELNIHDRSPSAGDGEQLGLKGQKRRASSPPSDGAREDRASGGGNDLYHRRSIQMLANRKSPITRPSQHPGSPSSTASLGPRGGLSFASTQGWNLSVASSATSYSGERLSPGALSPSAETEFGLVSPYAASKNVNRSPPSSLTKPHHRTQPEQQTQDRKMPTPTESQAHSRQNSVNKIQVQGFLVCECCPKKPKKFDNPEELRLHELEKQYQCQYCPNRFKNKNEAERHQNSLHLRRHSWSCAALSSVHAAFHPSSIHPTTADVCSYCGEEFRTPANWELRNEHLCQVHKFGECNQAKKFFRADHFRQHLKHSHAGTSGKWTNMLENACMKDEPLPQPLSGRGPGPNVGGPSMVSPGGMTANGAGGAYPGIINEVREES